MLCIWPMKRGFFAALLLIATLAHAEAPPGATGQYHDWFARQTNSRGEICCDIADGRILDLSQTRQTDAGWEVRVPAGLPAVSGLSGKAGEWIPVPLENVIYVENPTFMPVAWFYAGVVRCFVPPPAT